MKANMPAFQPLDREFLLKRLEPPTGRVRLIIDTDTKNEIDDQFAVTWALLSQDVFEILGILAAPYGFAYRREPVLAAYDALKADANAVLEPLPQKFAGSVRRMIQNDINPHELYFATPSEGVELSYQEILKVIELLGSDFANHTYRGSENYLSSYDNPVDSPAARFIVEQAMSLSAEDDPIYIAAIGCVTNIASAILMEPRIRERIVVTWTASYPTSWDGSNFPSLNLVQDPLASRMLFSCGVPHVYLPGYYVGELLSISLPEIERWVAPHGRIGAFLHQLYTNNHNLLLQGIPSDDLFGRSWVIWDLINFAWLMHPEWVPSKIRPAPILTEDLFYKPNPNAYPMREAYGLNRDEVYRDFFHKLARHAGNTPHGFKEASSR